MTRNPPRSLSSLCDDDLVRLWLESDPRALGELVRRHSDALRRRLRQQFAPDVAEEAHSMTLARLCGPCPYAHAGSFRAWLFTVGRHQALDLVRTRRRQLALSSRVRSDPGPSGSHWRPDRAAERLRLRRILQRALEGLPARHRQAVELHFLEDLDTDEVARALGMSRSQTRDRLRYALRLLREQVDGDLAVA